MDARLLEAFLRVAEMGSINRAAGALNVSQPALSRHIAALEHEMDVALFTRTQSGVQLTEAGRLLADRARPLLRQFARIKEEVSDSAAGQLSIGIPPSWRHVFTTHFLQAMLVQHPGIKLRVHEGVSHALRDLLLGGGLDLALVPFEASVATGLRQTALIREPLVVVGPAQRHFDPAQPLPMSRLALEPLVMPPRPNALRLQVDHALRRRQHVAQVPVETDTLLLCLDLARAGAGLTVAPACAVASPQDTQGLSWTALRGAYITWALYENTARSHSAAVRLARRQVLITALHGVSAGQWFGAEALPELTRAAASP